MAGRDGNSETVRIRYTVSRYGVEDFPYLLCRIRVRAGAPSAAGGNGTVTITIAFPDPKVEGSKDSTSSLADPIGRYCKKTSQGEVSRPRLWHDEEASVAVEVSPACTREMVGTSISQSHCMPCLLSGSLGSGARRALEKGFKRNPGLPLGQRNHTPPNPFSFIQAVETVLKAPWERRGRASLASARSELFLDGACDATTAVSANMSREKVWVQFSLEA